MNVYSSFIHNHPKLETTGKSSTGERINEKMAYPYSGYYSAIERKLLTHGTSEALHQVKAARLLYDLIYRVFWKLQSSKDRHQISGGWGWGEGSPQRRQAEIYEGNELVYILILETATQLYFKNHRTECLKT